MAHTAQVADCVSDSNHRPAATQGSANHAANLPRNSEGASTAAASSAIASKVNGKLWRDTARYAVTGYDTASSALK